MTKRSIAVGRNSWVSQHSMRAMDYFHATNLQVGVDAERGALPRKVVGVLGSPVFPSTTAAAYLFGNRREG